MKVVLLAGGLGTRLGEETTVRPKPMVEIGHRPILWHIMQHYSHFGHREFIVCLGYKGEHIKRYFADSLALGADVTIDFATNSVEVLDTPRDDWRVTLVDTGQGTQTGGRLLRVRSLLGDEPFLMTYGDGVSDVDLDELVAFHRARGSSGDGHGGSAARLALRQADHRGRAGDPVRREAADVGGLDQRRLLRARAGRVRLHPRRCRLRPSSPSRRSTAAGELSGYRPRGLLAVHGHAPRQGPAQLAVGQRTPALAGVEVVAPASGSAREPTGMRHRHVEASAGCDVLGLLADDLVGEVPREQQRRRRACPRAALRRA